MFIQSNSSRTYFLRFYIFTIGFIFLLESCSKSGERNTDSLSHAIVKDYDSQIEIPGAKVFLYRRSSSGISTFQVKDSAVSDANGRVDFIYPFNDSDFYISAKKVGHLSPIHIASMTPIKTNQTNPVYLARVSNLNLTIHRQNVYQVSDSLRLYVNYTYLFTSFPHVWTGYSIERKTSLADTVYSFDMIKYPAPSEKAIFYWQIIRNGSVFSSASDSTNLIQFGSKSFTINY